MTGIKFSSASVNSVMQLSLSPKTMHMTLQLKLFPFLSLPFAIHFAISNLSFASWPHENSFFVGSSPIKKKWVCPFVSSFSFRLTGLILGYAISLSGETPINGTSKDEYFLTFPHTELLDTTSNSGINHISSSSKCCSCNACENFSSSLTPCSC